MGTFEAAIQDATGESFEFLAVNSRTPPESLRAKTVDFGMSRPAEHVVSNPLTDAKPIIGRRRPDYDLSRVNDIEKIPPSQNIAHQNNVSMNQLAIEDRASDYVGAMYRHPDYPQFDPFIGDWDF